MIRYKTAIVVVRRTAARDSRTGIKAVVDSNLILLPVDADIEEGDHVEQLLPNGKTRTMLITKVDVLQSPFGSSALDHTEAHYTTATTRPMRAPSVDSYPSIPAK